MSAVPAVEQGKCARSAAALPMSEQEQQWRWELGGLGRRQGLRTGLGVQNLRTTVMSSLRICCSVLIGGLAGQLLSVSCRVGQTYVAI